MTCGVASIILYLPEQISRSNFSRSAAPHRSGTLRHHAFDFLDLSGQLCLFAGLLINSVCNAVELTTAARISRLGCGLDAPASAVSLGVAPPDIRLRCCELPRRKFARGEDTLADVLSIVVHSLVQKLWVGNHLSTRHTDLTIIVAEERRQEVVSAIRLVTNVLLATKRIEA